MTNGEKFKEVFKISQVDEGELYAYVWLPNHDAAEISIEWWNAEYQEPTTKNDLGVDAISRADARSLICKIDLKYQTFGMSRKAFKDLYNGMDELSSVTPQEPKWILVSEKLPNDRDWYLGIFKEPDTGWINPLPFICDYVGRETKETTKEYWILRGFTDRDVRDCDYYFNLECVAWMSLPKPYSEVEK